MSRSGGDREPVPCRPRRPRRRRRPAATVAVALALAGLCAPARAATPPRSLGGIEINPGAEQALVQIQELWLRWIGALYQQRPERADGIVDELLITVRRLGMSRLPDLSLGALARAVEAARDGDFTRARWALAAAERLDPGRPETAFATATVARLKGRYASAAVAAARGWWRLLALPAERRLWLHDLALYALYVLLASGLLFVALELAIHGAPLLVDLAHLFAVKLPQPVAYGLAVAVVAWPLALPHGAMWLALYWSALLWAYGAVSERVVLVALWVVVALAPFGLAAQRLRIEAVIAPPIRALDGVVAGRLYGDLFTDLGVLRSVAPGDPAVVQLFADFQRRLGDPDAAHALYRQVQQAEPDNVDVLLDLGAYHFFKRDYGSAIRYFSDAAAARPDSAAAYFNLSQAYSESYHFTELRRALTQAQNIDYARVGDWVRSSATQRIQTFDRGFARAPEIRRGLLAARLDANAAPAHQALVHHSQTLLAVLGIALAALAVARARRSLAGAGGEGDDRGAGASRWWRALVPGLASVQVGEGGRALGAIAIPVALLLFPLVGSLGYRLPLGYDPGVVALWSFAATGLAACFAIRVWRTLNEAG